LKKLFITLMLFISGFLLYFAAWPVPIEPISWDSPKDRGYTGLFKSNNRLAKIELLSIGDNHGPEDFAIDNSGRIYAATHEGRILRFKPDGTEPEVWLETEGRPLGSEFDLAGNLIVADALQGLLSIAPDKKITILTNMAEGSPIRYADDLDIAEDGKIYFSDASTKFGMTRNGDEYPTMLDILEHGGHGRLLCYDPATKKTKILVSGLNFANGVAVSHDQQYVLVCETGTYRVIRYWIAGPGKGKSEPFIENLPGFPDNISKGQNGLFWLAFFAPRNTLLDKFSNKPFLRKVIQRLPDFIKPKPVAYGHIVALDKNGQVQHNLQDPKTNYPKNTSVMETDKFLFIGSLTAPAAARLSKKKAGI
jgi:sugar lactone lactonase YvrE